MTQILSSTTPSTATPSDRKGPAHLPDPTAESRVLSAGHTLGMLVGAAAAPSLFTVAFARGVRVFHPEGETLGARFVATGDDAFARRLEGRALVRFSPTFARHLSEAPDVLGCAVRFRRQGDLTDPTLQAGDQDLLTATIRSFLHPKAALRSTNQHDYLNNVYWAVATFSVPGHGVGTLRWTGHARPSGPDTSRSTRLNEALASRDATLRLEFVSAAGESSPLGELRLEQRLEIDQSALRMSPFHEGRGLRAVGFINGIRRVTYWASEGGRGFRKVLSS